MSSSNGQARRERHRIRTVEVEGVLALIVFFVLGLIVGATTVAVFG